MAMNCLKEIFLKETPLSRFCNVWRNVSTWAIVIADSGLLSKTNISALEEDGYEYILGARPKNETENTKQRILGLELKDGGIHVIKRTE